MVIHSRSTGFTLLEVLLAMSLLSIMMVLLFTSLNTAAKSWHQGESKIAQVNEKLVVYRFFKRQLSAARPLWDDFSEPPQRYFSFQGDSRQFQFVSTFPNSAIRQGLQLFKIGLDMNDRQRLQVSVTPFYAPVNQSDWQPETVTLISQVDDLKITYFDINHDTWSTHWQENYLPGLVKIKLKLTDYSDWPTMIFRLRLANKQANSIKDRL